MFFGAIQFIFAQTIPKTQIVCVGNKPDKHIKKQLVKLLSVFFSKGQTYPDRIKLKDKDRVKDYETLIQDAGDLENRCKNAYPMCYNILRALTVQPTEIEGMGKTIDAHRGEITTFLNNASSATQQNWQQGDCAVLHGLGMMGKVHKGDAIPIKGKSWLNGCVESLRRTLVKD